MLREPTREAMIANIMGLLQNGTPMDVAVMEARALLDEVCAELGVPLPGPAGKEGTDD